jgi:pentatricopeptide repeat protein
MPKRGLAYTVATTNSLMYMYARTGRPDDALKVYELTKRLDLTCTVVTYGVLIKALLRSGKAALQDTSFEILRSLPELDINPGVEVYNQFFEHYAKMHDFRKMKMILRLMSDSKPRTKPDAVSYGHLIHCFAESRKPKSALSVYHQMLKRKIEPSSYTYMGILKALSHMKDGISCVQVLGEMRERGITPTKKHYAMTMFACLTCNQCLLAESVFNMSMKLGYKPDIVLYTLRLRAILQQGNWAEGLELLENMKQGKEAVRPNIHTYNMLLQFQVLDGRYEDAADTLNVILKEQERVKSAKGVKGVRLMDTMKSLSFAMGPYSNHVQALKREEDEEDEFGSLEATALDLTGSVDSVGITGIVEGTSDSSLLHKVVMKPTKDGLYFLVSSTEHMEQVTSAPIQGNFYTQLLRAVVLEGHHGLTKRMLVLRDAGKISMKEEDLVRVKPIEDIARRALAQAADAHPNF